MSSGRPDRRIWRKRWKSRDNGVINQGDAALPSSTCQSIFTDPPRAIDRVNAAPALLLNRRLAISPARKRWGDHLHGDTE